uniref:G_PROTEIN_RECEP_F1_2 domain-containing protein n=2 Tax=Caenorhabditis tropicalis TaxID=1561998 RepID=A0A1I7TIZ3_9PELO
MSYSMSRRIVETMPSGSWNDFTDLPVEFISQLGLAENDESKQPCFYTTRFVYFATSMDDILIVACLIATIINFVVVACSAKLFNEKGDTLHLFILNMTVGDSILTLFCHPYELFARRYAAAQIHSVTVFLNFANWVGLAVSGLSLTLLNVDKVLQSPWTLQSTVFSLYSSVGLSNMIYGCLITELNYSATQPGSFPLRIIYFLEHN